MPLPMNSIPTAFAATSYARWPAKSSSNRFPDDPALADRIKSYVLWLGLLRR